MGSSRLSRAVHGRCETLADPLQSPCRVATVDTRASGSRWRALPRGGPPLPPLEPWRPHACVCRPASPGSAGTGLPDPRLVARRTPAQLVAARACLAVAERLDKSWDGPSCPVTGRKGARSALTATCAPRFLDDACDTRRYEAPLGRSIRLSYLSDESKSARSRRRPRACDPARRATSTPGAARGSGQSCHKIGC